MCTGMSCMVLGAQPGETALGATAGGSVMLTVPMGSPSAASSGGAGGTMGREAFADLAVTTLRPGSSGGGGGGGGDPCPAFGFSYGVGGGGGGGGGALRIITTSTMTIGSSARISAAGGSGGEGATNVSSGGGGGGSGGAIDLRAPSLIVRAGASITAAGGRGGMTMGPNSGAGGAGGPGRVRLALDLAGACTVVASAFSSHTFASMAAPCDVARTTTLGTVYVSRFPE